MTSACADEISHFLQTNPYIYYLLTFFIPLLLGLVLSLIFSYRPIADLLFKFEIWTQRISDFEFWPHESQQELERKVERVFKHPKPHNPVPDEEEKAIPSPEERRRRFTCPPPKFWDTRKRIKWTDHGCNVFGWPSSGGVVIKEDAHAVDLQFLGLNRLDPQRERWGDKEREDEFVRRLRMIGGRCWRGEWEASKVWKWEVELDWEMMPRREDVRRVVYGWVSKEKGGGVWVRRYGGEGIMWPEEDEEVVGDQEEEEEDYDAVDLGRLKMAVSMEERCEIMEKWLGAKFYKNPRDYKGLKDLFPENEEMDQGEEIPQIAS